MLRNLTLIIGLIIAEYSYAQSNDINMTDILMKSTFLIEAKEGNVCGTGFIMSKRNKYKQEPDIIFITAAHVLNSIKGNYAIINFRVENNNNSTTVKYEIMIRDTLRNFYTQHPTMDIAVMYITPLRDFNYNDVLDVGWLANDNVISYYHINTGETINCIGYPSCFKHDNLENLPTLRSGAISSFLLPSITYKTFVYDFEIYPGNRGSPVYYYGDRINVGNNNIVMNGKKSQFIMGLVTRQELKINYNNNGSIKDTTYLKLGIVVQAPYILETIKMLP